MKCYLDINDIIHNQGIHIVTKKLPTEVRARSDKTSLKLTKKPIFTKLNNEIIDKVVLDIIEKKASTVVKCKE